MEETESERRLAENEAIFRESNEKLEKGIEETNRIAKEDNQPEFMIDENLGGALVSFFCECSDENCRKKVKLKLGDYKKIHKDRNRFVVLPGHERESIEKIITSNKNFVVVEKFVDPPEQPDELNITSTKNV